MQNFNRFYQKQEFRHSPLNLFECDSCGRKEWMVTSTESVILTFKGRGSRNLKLKARKIIQEPETVDFRRKRKRR